MDVSFTSAVVILLLVMDPVGNIPLFITLLKDLAPRSGWESGSRR